MVNPDAVRGQVLLEESREAVVVLDGNGIVVTASRRARQSLGVREVLDTGSGDTYGQYLPGQSFDLSGLRNGTYYIKIKTNPKKNLYEKKTSNNTSYRKVVIGGTAGDRTVKVAKVGIIKE